MEGAGGLVVFLGVLCELYNLHGLAYLLSNKASYSPSHAVSKESRPRRQQNHRPAITRLPHQAVFITQRHAQFAADTTLTTSTQARISHRRLCLGFHLAIARTSSVLHIN